MKYETEYRINRNKKNLTVELIKWEGTDKVISQLSYNKSLNLKEATKIMNNCLAAVKTINPYEKVYLK